MIDKRTFHLIFGGSMLAFGLFGFYDEWYNIVDLFMGTSGFLLTIVGALMVGLGIKNESETFKYLYLVLGAVLIVAGVYGIYDEWVTVFDLCLGIYPLVCLMLGVMALITGVNRLKS